MRPFLALTLAGALWACAASSTKEEHVYTLTNANGVEVRTIPYGAIVMSIKPVEARRAYGVEKDRYNAVTFTPVTTAGVRLEVTMQQGWSAGVQEWKVHPERR